MNDQPVLLRERRGHTEILTINRPHVRNAVDSETSEVMEAAFDEIEADRSVWTVILTGVDPVFSAGADLKAIAAGRIGGLRTARGTFAGIVHRDFSKPVIAAVNGHALAGGFEIALACDLIVASEEARFGLPEVQRGLLATGGGPEALAHSLPRALALELAMTGEQFSAARALELGLVNRVVARAAVLDEALALADRLAQNSPTAVRGVRELVRRSIFLDAASASSLASEIARRVGRSPDAKEGSRAFLEKRSPVWHDPEERRLVQ